MLYLFIVRLQPKAIGPVNRKKQYFAKLRRSESYLREKQIKSLEIEACNSSAAFNIKPESNAVTLSKLQDRILESAENLFLKQHAVHIPGISSKVPDSQTV
ncbi:MAG: hypothetical protein EZS28_029091 [Streblomastix strix]|uniref:Uncharacterized protein n=1 Tax=Streblomastix strix TaxID=222440 RepID=A0A5J4UZ12_9EUKA|nr:MAG: hypothetical protein EZS28_029091 [Streblomastix strix]